MAERIGYVLRNCMLWADRVSKIGNVSEITVPVPETKVEEFRTAGMIRPREVNLGYEKTELGFKMPNLDPQMVALFGLFPGIEKEFMVTGALVDEDGTTHSAVAFMRGYIKKVDAGAWAPGEKAETEYSAAIHYVKLEVDGESLIEIDDFDIVIKGVSQYQGIRNALLLE